MIIQDYGLSACKAYGLFQFCEFGRNEVPTHGRRRELFLSFSSVELVFEQDLMPMLMLKTMVADNTCIINFLAMSLGDLESESDLEYREEKWKRFKEVVRYSVDRFVFAGDKNKTVLLKHRWKHYSHEAQNKERLYMKRPQ